MSWLNFILSLPFWTSELFGLIGFSTVIILLVVLIIRGKWLVELILDKFFNKNNNQIKKHRSCGECISYIFILREKLQHEKDNIIGSILRQQMGYSEQKIAEVSSIFYSKYREIIVKKRKTHNMDEEGKQCLLFLGLLRETLSLIKDELRRSFKENGFHTISGTLFQEYVRGKQRHLLALSKQNLIDRYPLADMIVTVEDGIKNINTLLPQLEDLLFDVYTKAKEIKIDSEDKIDKLNNSFTETIDSYIKV